MKKACPKLKQWPKTGAALVLVLGMLVLIAVLVVAFLSSVTTDLRSAKSYASGSDARSLADSAVNVIISQIQDATSRANLTWTSQPGMIRTFDGSGNGDTSYKLYSSAELRVPGNFNAITSLPTEIPPDWQARPEWYTDLNQPVTVSGVNHYPIVSPAAVALDASGGTALEGNAPIEGCFLDSTNPNTPQPSGEHPLPLPVQWLYVLKDGTLAPMNASGKIEITPATMDDGTPNTIVGRIAFWTDDESSKVNINTSAEGTYWDRPWTEGSPITGSFPNRTASYEKLMALNMPAQNEFQRYPGHPAMTSLSTIFPRLPDETTLEYNKRIYGIIPRVNDTDATQKAAGSESGTKNVNQTSSAISPDSDRLFTSVDELFFQQANTGGNRAPNLKAPNAPFDETDIEKTRFFLTANSRSPEVNLFNKPRITLWPLQMDQALRNSKDKLIAFCSKVGGTPYFFQRYNTYTSPNQSPIPSSQSPTMDWESVSRNRELYDYLDHLTSQPIPGLGGTFANKYPDSRQQILTEMFDFVRSNVNTFSTGEVPNYYYAPFTPSGFLTGQSQIVPLSLPNGTKGFGRFSTITEAAIIFYRKDKLHYSVVDNLGNPVDPAKPPELVPDKPTPVTGKVKIHETTPPTGTGKINVGAVVILEPFNPSPGPPTWSGHVNYIIRGLEGLTLSGSTVLTPFPSGLAARNLVNALDSMNNATSQTGLEQYLHYKSTTAGKFTIPKTLGTANPEKNYAFYAAFEFPAGTTTMNFTGGAIAIELYPGNTTDFVPANLIQTIEMTFPPAQNLPIPSIPYTAPYNSGTNITNLSSGENKFTDFNYRIAFRRNYDNPGVDPDNGRYGIAEDVKPGESGKAHIPLPLVVGGNGSTARGDIVRSAEARYAGAARGDLRLYAGASRVPATYFEGHGQSDPAKGTPATNRALYADTSGTSRLVHSLSLDGMSGPLDTSSQNGYYVGAGSSSTLDPRGKLLPGLAYPDPNRGATARNRKVPAVPRGLDGAYMQDGTTLGDWDTGVGAQVDGPFINPADQCTANTSGSSGTMYYTPGNYIQGSGVVETGASFSPNRQIASAVSFGSLPTGINPNDAAACKPWQTLLFTRNPLGGATHPGFGQPLNPAQGLRPPYQQPPDHAFLDLFTMPIVEPYAISEPFSTAGKVNMNYQIVPFTYLTRSTGVRAVLKSTRMMAIPQADVGQYKLSSATAWPADYRYEINPDEATGTLAGFEERFRNGDVFRSASEICDISLVPGNNIDGKAPAGIPTYSTMSSWWNNYQLTGDNVRESPYGHIYPRLTTKSNTFTVYVKAQSLKKAIKTPEDTFVEGRDQITGEFRGSFIIERALDPNSDSLVKRNASGKFDPATETDPDGMVGPYKYRVLSNKRFAP